MTSRSPPQARPACVLARWPFTASLAALGLATLTRVLALSFSPGPCHAARTPWPAIRARPPAPMAGCLGITPISKRRRERLVSVRAPDAVACRCGRIPAGR